MSTIKDVTDTEQWAVSSTLKQRWPNQQVEIQLADVEIKLFPHDRELTTCPALFWQVGETSFIIVKVGERTYRSQFYYRGYQQYGTGKSEFDDIADCVTTLLQVHAKPEKMGSSVMGQAPSAVVAAVSNIGRMRMAPLWRMASLNSTPLRIAS